MYTRDCLACGSALAWSTHDVFRDEPPVVCSKECQQLYPKVPTFMEEIVGDFHETMGKFVAMEEQAALEHAAEQVPPKMVTDKLGGMDARWEYVGLVAMPPESTRAAMAHYHRPDRFWDLPKLISAAVPPCVITLERIGSDTDGFIWAGRCEKLGNGVWFRAPKRVV